MNVRTQTSHLDSISVTLPGGPVTVHFPQSDLTTSLGKQNHCIIVIPAKSTWGPSKHWHEAYTEHIHVLKGKLKVTVNGRTRIVGPEDGFLTFEKYDVHDFRAAREEMADRDGEVWIEEYTDPEDGFKPVFFYNMVSILLDRDKLGLISTVIQLLVTIQYADNFVPIFPTWMPFRVNYWACHGFYRIAKGLGDLLGYEAWHKEYTPEQYWDIAESGGVGGKKEM